MSRTSDKTIRIRSIPQHNAAEAFANYTERLKLVPTKKFPFLRSSHAPADVSILTSLARQRDENVGTISFPSRQLKEKALASRDCPSGWILDDKFDGITMLYSSEEPELEYVSLR